MNTKFEFVSGDTLKVDGVTLTRIRALRDIPEALVKAGDLGGYLESEKNLSESGSAWVSDEARVFGRARVSGDARVYDRALVSGEALVSGLARVFGKAWVLGKAHVSGEAKVYGEAWIAGDAHVSRWVQVSGAARVAGEACVSPLFLAGLHWNVTITDLHMNIGCMLHEIEAWGAFTDAEIAAMDGKDALRFWRENKDALMTLARAHAKKAAEAK